jgi:phosphoesterase RecJ-like protein
MALDWQPFVDAVDRHQSFLLTTHVRPDGDGLGSMKALAEALRRRGKNVQLIIPGSLPPRYQFLDPYAAIRSFSPPGDDLLAADVLVILDTGTRNQLADLAELVQRFSGGKFVIDHHVTQDNLGAVQIIDPSAEATGRLVREAIQALDVELNSLMAEALFVALAMDTGWFRHGNTRPQTLTLAAELVEAGADPQALYQQLFERNSLGRLKLTGLVLGRLTTVAGGIVAYSEIRAADYALTHATPADSEDLVNYLMSLSGVEVGLLFMEQPGGGVKVSFRSRGKVNVARLAEKFGGGGHPVAAGATLQTTLAAAQDRILQAVDAALSWSV